MLPVAVLTALDEIRHLTDAGISTAFSPEEDPDAAMAEVIDEYALLDEAIAKARAALPPLLAALAA